MTILHAQTTDNLSTVVTQEIPIANKQKAIDEILYILLTLPPDAQNEILLQVKDKIVQQREKYVQDCEHTLAYIKKHKDILRRRRRFLFF